MDEPMNERDFCFDATGAKETTKGCELIVLGNENNSIAAVKAVYPGATTPSEDIDDE